MKHSSRRSCRCSSSTINTPGWQRHGTTTSSPRSVAAAWQAGKRLGYKIRTVASDPEQRANAHVVVWVVVIDSTPNDENRIRERGELLISQNLNRLLG